MQVTRDDIFPENRTQMIRLRTVIALHSILQLSTALLSFSSMHLCHSIIDSTYIYKCKHYKIYYSQ